MIRPARIIQPIDAGRTTLTFAAEGAHQPYAVGEPTHGAALFELEMLCAPDRLRKIDIERFVDILDEDAGRRQRMR